MTRPHTTATPFDVTGLHELPRVDIVYAYGGADGVLVEAARAHGAAGLVLVCRWCSPPARWRAA